MEAYHEDAPSEIRIGEGFLNLDLVQQAGLTSHRSYQTFQVVLESTMSRKMQATLEIRVDLAEADPERHEMHDENSQIS